MHASAVRRRRKRKTEKHARRVHELAQQALAQKKAAQKAQAKALQQVAAAAQAQEETAIAQPDQAQAREGREMDDSEDACTASGTDSETECEEVSMADVAMHHAIESVVEEVDEEMKD